MRHRIWKTEIVFGAGRMFGGQGCTLYKWWGLEFKSSAPVYTVSYSHMSTGSPSIVRGRRHKGCWSLLAGSLALGIPSREYSGESQRWPMWGPLLGHCAHPLTTVYQEPRTWYMNTRVNKASLFSIFKPTFSTTDMSRFRDKHFSSVQVFCDHISGLKSWKPPKQQYPIIRTLYRVFEQK